MMRTNHIHMAELPMIWLQDAPPLQRHEMDPNSLLAVTEEVQCPGNA